MVVITWKITTSILASGKTSNYPTKIDIFREMAYKEVISFCSTVTVLLIVEERCHLRMYFPIGIHRIFWFILVSQSSSTTGMPLTEKCSTPLKNI